MAFDSRSGVCTRIGPPSFASLYAPQMCFQPAFVPSIAVSNQAFSCRALTCGLGTASLLDTKGTDNGSNPFSSRQPHSPWEYECGNPHIVVDVAWEEVEKIAKCEGWWPQFQEFACKYAFGKSLFLVKYRGEEFLATPLNIVAPECILCLKTVWQCGRFCDAAKSDPEARKLYECCLEYQNSFFYDTVRKDGTLIPVMIKITPIALKVATAALSKCALQCGNCQPNTPLARGENVLFS